MRAVRQPQGEAPALIGPNAVLQMAAAMERQLGAESSAIILATAGICALPSGQSMIPERDALQLHRALSALSPRHALTVAREAGSRTADYIIAHRIPLLARNLLRLLPARFAGPLLMAAIRRHAWTFVGAGAFTVEDAWSFSIDRAGLNEGAVPRTAYVWYGAVFSRLYQQLVRADCVCRELPGAAPGLSRHVYRIAPFAA
ncbi:bacteriochlorophyll 4-vinyl reductase [Erythrobacter sp. EC-HK427]|uniref:bacteriochlorophyll 4-vinyl reductase n=1 Tax=Erythrobacter sp. EC-HK427 TaxID=2038396 RepID=UPI00125C2527|nr:bacteriochlorophyll 4-vinyl reductase [Erythrobacter sp. EC-HK427]VVS97170.1 Bacteriochlorophyll 4-vinyl reductase [Erythrobacter sp. EC-HK427]